MINKLSDYVWWGDKPSVQESLGRFKSVINVAHSIRRPYWQNLNNLHWQVWYFRLASPDREPLPESHMDGLISVLEAIRVGGKLPLLCHCKMGGHRGPSTALLAHWHLSGRTEESLRAGTDTIDAVMCGKFVRNSSNPARRFQQDVIAYCQRNSRPTMVVTL